MQQEGVVSVRMGWRSEQGRARQGVMSAARRVQHSEERSAWSGGSAVRRGGRCEEGRARRGGESAGRRGRLCKEGTAL